MSLLLTGASGFLGHALDPALRAHFDVRTLGRSRDSDLEVDLSLEVPQLEGIGHVVHAAGKAHVVPRNAPEEAAFHAVNVAGTQRLLSALEGNAVQKFVFISSVSVYGLEEGTGIKEGTPLLGQDPYARSKIQAEQLVEEWCRARGIDWLILRLPLVAGPNPPGNLGKLMEGIRQGRYVRIRGVRARKSMVLATDVADLIARWLSAPSSPSGIYHLTDGHNPTFYDLEEAIRIYYRTYHLISVSSLTAWILGFIGDRIPAFPLNSATYRKVTRSLTFSDEKARKELGWRPNPVLGLFEHEGGRKW